MGKGKKSKVEVPGKTSTGLRSSVRYGLISPQNALADLRKRNTPEDWPIMSWLRHRKKVAETPKVCLEPGDEVLTEEGLKPVEEIFADDAVVKVKGRRK